MYRECVYRIYCIYVYYVMFYTEENVLIIWEKNWQIIQKCSTSLYQDHISEGLWGVSPPLTERKWQECNGRKTRATLQISFPFNSSFVERETTPDKGIPIAMRGRMWRA